MPRFLIVTLFACALLLPVGCATKKFVRQEFQKIETGVEQNISRLESDLSQEKDRGNRVASQVTEARSLSEELIRRVEQAFAKADQAIGIAGQAVTKAEKTDSRLSRLWANRNKRSLMGTVVVTFGFDKWELEDRGETALLDVVKQLKEKPDLVVDLEGHTDNGGPTSYNVQLSQRRAEAVRRFLVEKGVDLRRIQSIGLGQTHPVADNRSQDGRAQNRRVVIKLFMPSE